MLRIRQSVRTLFLVVLTAMPSVASAEPIRFNFQTTLTGVASLAASLGLDVQTGDSFVGSATFEVTDPPFSEGPNGALRSASGTITLPFVTIPVSHVQTINDVEIGDFFGVVGRDSRELPGEYEGFFAVLGFQDPSGALLTSLAVPDVSVIGRFPGGPFQSFLLSTFVGNRTVTLAVGTMELTENQAPVPEPGTLLLLGTGVAALGRRGWRRPRTGGTDEPA